MKNGWEIDLILNKGGDWMYLDNASTTPLKSEVKDYIISLLDTYQNPSSMYQSGVNAKQIITIFTI